MGLRSLKQALSASNGELGPVPTRHGGQVPDREPNYELIRERLRRARRQRGLSLREVAEEIDVSPSTLSRLERETGTPDLPTINKLIRWLELDRDAVFGVRPKLQGVHLLLRHERKQT